MSPTALLLALACQTVQSAEFPIGLYNVQTVAGLQEAHAAGFTHILGESEEIASHARNLGLGVIGIPHPNPVSARPSSAPSISAWYISDEPEVNQQSTGTISDIAGEVRRWSPGTPLTLVIGEGKYAAAYAPFVDVMMVDWYPVPHLPLESAGEQVSIAVNSSAGKPVWAVLQAMDWRDYPQRDHKKPRIGRFPNFSEIRFMTYHAILRGASGIFYFEFIRRYSEGETLLDYPERWQRLKDVVRELRFLKPFFESGPGEVLDVPGLEAKAWRRNGDRVTIYLNSTPTEAALPESALDGTWKAAFAESDDVRNAFPLGRLGGYKAAVLIGR